LVSSPDTIFTRRQLLDEIWGMESMADERTVDVHIKRIRERYRDSNDFEKSKKNTSKKVHSMSR
ncbi:MAG: helix-turn-helix domain-containing protein, partial [Intestinibacter bartlettii]|nr:helix-turn-helix domain-containing protein [Intestinibacter bartlettii]